MWCFNILKCDTEFLLNMQVQNFIILKIYIQGLSRTIKHLICFQVLSRALDYFFLN